MCKLNSFVKQLPPRFVIHQGKYPVVCFYKVPNLKAWYSYNTCSTEMLIVVHVFLVVRKYSKMLLLEILCDCLFVCAENSISDFMPSISFSASHIILDVKNLT